MSLVISIPTIRLVELEDLVTTMYMLYNYARIYKALISYTKCSVTSLVSHMILAFSRQMKTSYIDRVIFSATVVDRSDGRY